MKEAEWLPGQAVSPRWQLRAAKTLFAIQLGKMLQNDSESDADVLVPYLKAGHVQWDGVVTDDPPQMWANPRELSKYDVRDGDLLVCEGGDVGRAATLSGGPTTCIIQNSLHRVRPKGTSNSRFFKYALEHLAHAGWFNVLCNKATIAHLTGDKLAAIRVPAPPGAEQDRVVGFLDGKTAAIDELIKKKQRLIELLQEKRQALITQSVTKGLDPKVSTKDSGVSWMGTVPAHWDVMRVKHVARVESGHTPSRSVPEHWLDSNDIPWVSLNDTKWLAENDYISETAYSINELGLQNSSARMLPSNVVVFTRDATLGKAAITTRPMAVSQHVIAWVCGNRISPEFLLRVFYAMEPALDLYTFGATLKTIGMDDVGELVTPVPPLPEQRLIIDYVVREVGKLRSLLQAVQQQVNLLLDYRQAVISAAVTGELDLSKEAA